MFSWARAACALATVLLPSLPVEAQYWVLTDLGDVPQYSGWLRPLGISPDGAISGTAIVAEGQDQRGFVWIPYYPNASAGETTAVPLPEPGAPVVVPEAISSAGLIAGWYTVSGAAGGVRAFRWDRREQAMTLISPGSDARISDMNELGECVGDLAGRSSFWGDQGQLALPNLEPYLAVTASSVNSAGAATGSLEWPTGGPSLHTALWTGEGAFDLGAPPGALAARGRAINDFGQVAGEAYNPDLPLIYPRMFLWTPVLPMSSTGFYTDLGMVGSHPLGMVNDINNDGEIVGTEIQNNEIKAFVWRPDYPNGVSGSKTLLSNLVFPGSGWLSLDEANAINDFGQIAGVGKRTGGLKRGFLLTPLPFPLPRIISVAPSSVQVGIPPGSVTVSGSGFAPASVVRVNGNNRTTTFASTTRLDVALATVDTAVPQRLAITVYNPEPGGGTSNAAALDVGRNPEPSVSGVVPSPLYAGGPGITITVLGSGFVPASGVLGNGQTLTTTYVSSQELAAFVDASLLASIGSMAVSVSSPSPGGGLSTGFIVSVLGNPQPALSSISPDVVLAGSSGFYLYGYGSGFTQNSIMRCSASGLSTSASNDTELVAFVPESAVGSPGSVTVDVWSPAPGGGTSQTRPLIVTSSPAPIARDDIVETARDSGVVINVTANDADPDYSEFTVTQVSATSAGGTLWPDGNGSFLYQPKSGFIGADSFTYRLIDSELHLSNLGRVLINVGTVPMFGLTYVEPSRAEPGESVSVVVDVEDSNGYITSVKAAGKSLSSTNGKHWTGTIVAGGDAGHQTVSIEASDNAGNKRYASARYLVAPVLFARMRDLNHPLTLTMAGTYSYRVAGWVETSQDDSFTLSEAFGGTGLQVECAGHGLAVGEYVMVKGELQKRSGEPVLALTGPSKIEKVTAR